MDHNTSAPIQGTVPLSTSLDTSVAPGPAGNGTPNLTEPKQPAPKPESVGDTLRGELARVREEEAKTEKPEADKAKAEDGDKASKPEKDAEAKGAKPEEEKTAKPRGEDGKFAKAEKDEETADKADKSAAEKPAAERSAPEERQSEGRKHSEPPARFLPEARAKWANVPNEVKAEFHRVSQEHEQEVSQYRESHENWQKLAKFDQMAKQHGTSVADALERYTAVDGLLQSNPVEGIRQVLSIVGITPEQYARHVLQNPQAHQQPQQRVPDQRMAPQQASPEIAALRQEIEALKAERNTDQVTPIIQAFAADRGDFNSVWPQMEKIILSGVIDQIYGAGLSPEQKLAEAYRMAGGKGPSSRSDPPQLSAAHSTPANDRPVDPDGQKSVRGAPNGGKEPDDDAPETDIRALLRKEMRKAV